MSDESMLPVDKKSSRERGTSGRSRRRMLALWLDAISDERRPERSIATQSSAAQNVATQSDRKGSSPVEEER